MILESPPGADVAQASWREVRYAVRFQPEVEIGIDAFEDFAEDSQVAAADLEGQPETASAQLSSVLGIFDAQRKLQPDGRATIGGLSKIVAQRLEQVEVGGEDSEVALIATPAPGAFLLMLAGLLGVGGMARRKRQA